MEIEQQQFNMSVATLQRIDNLLQRLSVFQIIDNVVLTQRTLKELWKECNPFMDNEDRQTAMLYWKKIELCGLRYKSQDMIEFNRQFHECVNDMDFWIRDILLKKGLLMAKPENPALAVSQMR